MVEELESSGYNAAMFATDERGRPEVLKYAVICDSISKLFAVVMDSKRKAMLIPRVTVK